MGVVFVMGKQIGAVRSYDIRIDAINKSILAKVQGIAACQEYAHKAETIKDNCHSPG